MVVPAPRGGGKCLDQDTEILLANGTRKRIADVEPGQDVISYSEATGKMERDRIANKFQSAVKRCIRIRTRTGKTVILTPEHRVLTFDGWKQAQELTLDSRIASPRHVRIRPTSNKKSSEEIRFTAYMIAEGGTTGRGTRWTNADPVLVEDFLGCATSLGFSVRPSGKYGYGVSGATRWKKRNGFYGVSALTKRLPAWVFGLTIAQKWEFLAALIDTDGWMQPDRGRIAITLANKGLIEDVAYLWLQVGVVGSVYDKPNAKAGAWCFTVDQESVGKVMDRLPLRLKGASLAACAKVERYSLIDTYPCSIYRGLPPGTHERFRNLGAPRLDKKDDVTRPKLRRAIAVEPFPKWVSLEKAQVFWDKVVCIEDVGDRLTYDVEVERNHNLITNLLVSHNSSTVEMAVAYISQKFTRRFVLIVSDTQDQADRHVGSIGTTMEKLGIARSVTQYGSSKGWSCSLLRAANGFNVRGIGLDSASARGIKLDEFRPDWIIFDDIDHRADVAKTVKKKIEALTQTILPAGSSDCAILFVQNLVHDGSIMAQIVDGSADFLTNRILLPVEPAIRGLEYEPVPLPNGRKVYRITAGTATWEGQDIRTCEAQIAEQGPTAWLRESQQLVYGGSGWFFNPDEIVEVTPEEVPVDLKAIGRGWDLAATEGGGDWTVGTKTGIARNGVYYILDIDRDQLSSDRVKKRLLAVAQADRAEHHTHKVRLRFAIDPGQAGIYQQLDLEDYLKAFDPSFVALPGRGSKSERAQGFAEQVNLGNYRVVTRPGDREYDRKIQEFKKELRKFREDGEHDHDDQVDSATDAHQVVTEPPKQVSAPGVAASQNSAIENYQPGQADSAIPNIPGREQPGGAIIGEGYDPLSSKV